MSLNLNEINEYRYSFSSIYLTNVLVPKENVKKKKRPMGRYCQTFIASKKSTILKSNCIEMNDKILRRRMTFVSNCEKP
ncbi:hypothetical protein DERP_001640 [Dermatophagoides pteronyssinus]|uniref:Uncharacterized protein n=1 Tax=Dermatophagoides pteronyssinus TaxID=6956 RepID=A0ABQ8JB56_DERPT|nr:hypothetical protein DERP_001640 [Dermatophagoides pteronyssinus]